MVSWNLVFLGGAQIDAYGNLNSTVIGDHAKPKVRLPGSGGANDVGFLLLANHCYYAPTTNAAFLEKIDFVTTPGYLDGPNAREEAGLPKGSGPYRVVTNLCVMGYDDESKLMKLLSLNPGVTKEEVIEKHRILSFCLPMKLPKTSRQPPKNLKSYANRLTRMGCIVNFLFWIWNLNYWKIILLLFLSFKIVFLYTT